MFYKITSGRRWRLKTATAPHHERLDGLNAEFAMFGSLAAYKNYLRATYASRLTLESMLDASNVAALLPDWEGRKIQAQLIADFSDLRDGEETLSPSACRPIGGPVDLPTIIGTLYVLEGSALGAAVLVKRAAALGLSPEYGARHLARQVANLPGWNAMIKLLDSAPFEESDEDRCVQASIAAFDAFEYNYRKFFCAVAA